MIRHRSRALVRLVRTQWKSLLLKGVLPGVAMLILVQLLYPADRLPLFLTVDGQTVGWQPVKVAASQLDAQYNQMKLGLYFGQSTDAYRTPRLSAIGLAATNTARLEQSTYPLWLRLVPTSLLWASAVMHPPAPSYARDESKLAAYIEKELGSSCNVAPKSATLAFKEAQLTIVPAIPGGTCQPSDVRSRLLGATPLVGKETTVRVPMKSIAPAVGDDKAKALKAKLEERVKDGVSISVGAGNEKLARQELLSWLDFGASEQEVTMAINRDRAKPYFDKTIAPKVARAAGVSKVSTLDFTETSRVNGANGQTLDLDKTLADVHSFLAGTGATLAAATKAVAPRIEYTRSYSPTDTGLSALLQQYAESHPGMYGISLVELGGRHRRAVFQDTKVFRTASTYKLFVAYGALKRVEAGSWQWSDQIHGGRSLEKCLDDMIVRSDNPCGEALLQKIGFRPLSDEMKAIGLSGNTSFLKDVPQTTAGDLAVFLGALQSGQLLNPDSTNRLLGLMKRNIFRQGIPAGTSSQVADKVGFLDGLLHDAAIIYGPDGPVILTIMSDGSSWATLADLTRQIEALRAK